jgi:MFS family permease
MDEGRYRVAMQGLDAVRALTPDVRLLFGTRCARLFAYGFLSVVLVLYLSSVGLSDREIGLLLTMTLLGDTAISLWISTAADRTGRRKMLVVGALLMAFAGGLFALTSNFWWLLAAATIGVISPSGNEVGPFLSIEQAALSQLVPEGRRVEIFAWYNLVGSVATAAGALAGGGVAQLVQWFGIDGPGRYRPLVIGYALVGVVLAWACRRLSAAAEVKGTTAPGGSAMPRMPRFGLGRSLPIVLKLSGLFALDAFGGGFVIQSIVAYWFYRRFAVEPAAIGAIFFGANLLAGISALSAAWVARRIGLVNTMVFTHLPSNVFLILVPLMPSLPLAILVLLLRFSISQMDVPARQSYTMAVVAPEERSAAAGVTGIARSLGAAMPPMLAGLLVEQATLASLPFFLAGGIKIVYDLLLYRSFVAAGQGGQGD